MPHSRSCVQRRQIPFVKSVHNETVSLKKAEISAAFVEKIEQFKD